MTALEGLPLKRGDQGVTVRDLHRRLAEAGFPPPDLLADEFTADTMIAVQAFQESRRIEVDGVVGRHTWIALAEAAHRLGDRLLYHKQSPMLRGDDVADLQRRLGSLGFDAGRVDGIFGPETAAALSTFQRNAGLPSDAIFGPATHAALGRLGARSEHESVATVRERERLRGHELRAVADRHLLIGELGGLGAVADTVRRHLVASGLHNVDVVSHPDESHLAKICNQLDVDGFLNIIAADDHRCSASYFSTTGFSSPGGLALAELLAGSLIAKGFSDAVALGQRLPVLRETRMPVVVLRIGEPSRLLRSTPELAEAITVAVGAWLEDPVSRDDQAAPA